MSALLRAEVPNQPLHVLIVHGMGTPAPYAFEAFIRSLADRFGLVQIPPLKPEPQPQGCYSVTPAQEALVHPSQIGTSNLLILFNSSDEDPEEGRGSCRKRRLSL
jgi:hypothetical protein